MDLLTNKIAFSIAHDTVVNFLMQKVNNEIDSKRYKSMMNPFTANYASLLVRRTNNLAPIVSKPRYKDIDSIVEP